VSFVFVPSFTAVPEISLLSGSDAAAGQREGVGARGRGEVLNHVLAVELVKDPVLDLVAPAPISHAIAKTVSPACKPTGSVFLIERR
jgi:hypothetical protein